MKASSEDTFDLNISWKSATTLPLLDMLCDKKIGVDENTVILLRNLKKISWSP